LPRGAAGASALLEHILKRRKKNIMTNFEGFGLSPDLNRALKRMNYTAPTPIQEKAIPIALQGRDILGSAQTGTGKTAAFGIPLVEALLRSPRGSALVLTPTRELAKQVLEVIHQLLGPQSPIKTAFIIGGEPMGKQFSQLRARPRIIVGTPGRINDHLDRGSLMLSDTAFLVLDETDRMLDMGFGVQLDRILKFLPAKRQTLMFSATLPDGIIKLSSKYLTNPERVSMGATNVVARNIKQDVIRITQDKKYTELVSQLHERNGSVIIFIKTKHGAEKMAKRLIRDGFEADALHGDLRQSKRTSVMNNFRRKSFRVLVATDIAARGLDVPHIEHVINYDLPQVAEDYIHRMGRTARAGAEGSALCFVSPEDGRKWHAIERLLNPQAVSQHREHRSFPGQKPGSKGRNERHGKKRFHRHRSSRPKMAA
jgi:superfamily II DNA/RNA helicase